MSDEYNATAKHHVVLNQPETSYFKARHFVKGLLSQFSSTILSVPHFQISKSRYLMNASSPSAHFLTSFRKLSGMCEPYTAGCTSTGHIVSPHWDFYQEWRPYRATLSSQTISKTVTEVGKGF